tara:strand:- start:178739 stop:179218 length:480 start_codon:yes stop_codon:yes gene_type:complete
MSLVFDIETDGFVKDMTTIHCVVTLDTDDNKVKTYYGKNLANGIKELEIASEIIGHNIEGFDIPAIQKLYSFKPKGKISDTLKYVRNIWPNIQDEKELNKNIPEELKGRHSLDAWGYRLGENKGKYDVGWDKFTEEMLEYCIQDVRVTSLLWKLICSKI